MNLLDKKVLGLIPFLAFAFFSCEEENELGSNINPAEDRLQIEFQEFTLPSSNIFLDSIRTDEDTHILTGRFSDEIFGQVTAEGYRGYNVIVGRGFPQQGVVLDSIVLNLAYDFSNFFASTNGIQTHELSVSQIEDPIFPAAVIESDEKGQIIEGSEIGRVSFTVNPTVDSVLSFRLNDEFGVDLLERLRDLEESGLPIFLDGTINPLAFTTTDDSESLIAFLTNTMLSNIMLYYQTPTEDSLSFMLTMAGETGYNYVSTDRSNSTVFSGVTGDESELIEDGLGELVFMNPLTGILPRIELREVFEFFTARRMGAENNINIISAELVMPIDPSDTSEFETFSRNLLYLFGNEEGEINGSGARINARNNIVLTNDSYLGLSPNGVDTPLTGLLDDDQFSILGDMTVFTQLLIENENVEELLPQSLVMMPITASSNRQTSFFRNGIKLRVFYTVLN